MSDLLEQVVMPQREPTRLIPLTQGQFAIVDAGDFDWLSQWKWHADWNPRKKQWSARTNVTEADGRQRGIRMHRMIMGDAVRMVDHIDGNTLNNCRSNLRACTPITNGRNRSKVAPSSSRFKGVSWNRRQGYWGAYIRIDKQLKYLGCFSKEVDAARAYNDAATRHFGPFARLNDLTAPTQEFRPQREVQSVGRNNATGFRGVCRVSKSSKYAAQIYHDGKTYKLGGYSDPREAALAYDQAAIRLLGSKAVLNFPAERALN